MDLAGQYGAPYGTWPTRTDVYDFHYGFTPCRAGGRRELLWRLLLRSTLEEALSLDSFPILSARLDHDGAHEAARLLESVMADEVFHVEGGLKWCRHLCDGDDDRVFREREQAHRYYATSYLSAREAYVEENPDEAIREAEEMQEIREAAVSRYPFDLRVFMAKRTRRAIGFTPRDLRQVRSWGYALG
jgi:hypothetical protein